MASTKQGAQSTEKAAGGRAVSFALHFLNSLLQLLQPFVRCAQRLILDDDRLRQQVGRIGLRTNLVGNEALGLAVTRTTRTLSHAIEQVH